MHINSNYSCVFPNILNNLKLALLVEVLGRNKILNAFKKEASRLREVPGDIKNH